MKKLRMISAVVCFLLTLTVSHADQAVYTLQVDGLGCPFCVYGIEKQLRVIDGVDNIKVDLNKGLVFVNMQQNAILDKKQAKKAVTDAGFTLRSFKQINEDKPNAPSQ